jgi:hypothetical protein
MDGGTGHCQDGQDREGGLNHGPHKNSCRISTPAIGTNQDRECVVRGDRANLRKDLSITD